MSNKYTYRVTWYEPDEEYLGTCAEFPSLSWLADSPAAALAGIQSVVHEAFEDMLANDETPPEPLATKTFSGSLSLRLTPELHRDLATEAAERNMSLNRWLNDRLARGT